MAARSSPGIGAAEAFDSSGAPGLSGGAALGIVRTAWLFGPGKPDFPARIAAAARQAASDGRTLRLVADETGTPTYVPDLADAVIRLADSEFQGVHHVVNGGIASRAEWARDVLERLAIEVPIEEISLGDHVRPSRPPRWGVLEADAAPGEGASRLASGDGGADRGHGERRMSGHDRIPGAAFGTLQRHADIRGGFAEAWRPRGSNDVEPFPAVQANLSSSATGVLRGLHLHQRQSDLWIVVSGVAFTALVDIRPMLSDPAAAPIVETATLRRDETVRIPVLVAHGFLAIEPLELLYLVTNEYDASDELGFAWDDPEVAVRWPQVATPDGLPILSDRDRRNPSAAELVGALRQGT